MSENRASNHTETTTANHDEKSPAVPPLFRCIPVARGVAVTALRANKIQCLALADLLHTTRQLGVFQQSVYKDDIELRIPAGSLDNVQAFLNNITEECLEPHIRSVELAHEAALKQEAEKEAVKKMTVSEFGQLLFQRSGSRLMVYSGAVRRLRVSPCAETLLFKSSRLLPVTHFKALARLANYHSPDQVFVYSDPAGGDLSSRLELLALAEKIARSKKKVTVADIAARRAKQRAKMAAPNADQIEQYIIDMFGFGEDKPEHIADAIKALNEGWFMLGSRAKQ